MPWKICLYETPYLPQANRRMDGNSGFPLAKWWRSEQFSIFQDSMICLLCFWSQKTGSLWCWVKKKKIWNSFALERRPRNPFRRRRHFPGLLGSRMIERISLWNCRTSVVPGPLVRSARCVGKSCLHMPLDGSWRQWRKHVRCLGDGDTPPKIVRWRIPLEGSCCSSFFIYFGRVQRKPLKPTCGPTCSPGFSFCSIEEKTSDCISVCFWNRLPGFCHQIACEHLPRCQWVNRVIFFKGGTRRNPCEATPKLKPSGTYSQAVEAMLHIHLEKNLRELAAHLPFVWRHGSKVHPMMKLRFQLNLLTTLS